ncbi:MAG: 30S ribosomal protein S2 [Patescibacteria group bacterium]
MALKEKKSAIEAMFQVGAHFGQNRSRRHPSAKPYIFGIKNNIEIFDLEKTESALEKAKKFVASVATAGRQALFVAGKSEAIAVVKAAASKANQPMVAGRWVGGTLTNFAHIRKRVEKYQNRLKEKEKGELAKYTKKERLLIDKEIAKLELLFGGIVSMREKPGVLIVVDPKKEFTAVEEARQTDVPVVAVASSDCDLSLVDYVIPANDSGARSIAFFIDELARAYAEAGTPGPETK